MPIEDINIGKHEPFIIAEMSANHNKSLKRAIKLVESAAEAGCNAVKIQTYTEDTMTIDCNKDDFLIKDDDSLWKGYNLYQLYKEACIPWEWHEPIFNRCKELGMIGFSTSFDESSFEFLESIDVPIYKIASYENTDIPLIEKIASTGKPLIISTGMATIAELDEAVRTARHSGCTDIILLKCTSSYPAKVEYSNLSTIAYLKELFGVIPGVSDHTLGIGASIAAVALGAKVVEKHLTLRRSDGGIDAPFSLEPHEMKMLVKECKNAYYSIGKVHFGVTKNEKDSLKYRRSVYSVEDIKKGEKINTKNVRSIRPGKGLAPKYLPIIIGKIVSKDVTRGTPIKWDLIE